VDPDPNHNIESKKKIMKYVLGSVGSGSCSAKTRKDRKIYHTRYVIQIIVEIIVLDLFFFRRLLFIC
jgi:hypothetical protein